MSDDLDRVLTPTAEAPPDELERRRVLDEILQQQALVEDQHVQDAVRAALAHGLSIAETARRLGLTETVVSTIAITFEEEYEQGRSVRARIATDRLNDMATDALDALRRIVNDDSVPARDRVSAARALLDRTKHTAEVKQVQGDRSGVASAGAFQVIDAEFLDRVRGGHVEVAPREAIEAPDGPQADPFELPPPPPQDED